MADINFAVVLKNTCQLSMVKIDRSEFLTKELSKYCQEHQVQKAVYSNPAQAGISKEIMNKIAEGAIKNETKRVTVLSAATGIPGGLAMFGFQLI